CIYLDCHSKYFNEFEVAIKEKGDLATEKDKDFSNVIACIREIIDTNQLEGAAVGAYNPSIIAQKLGLINKLQHSGDTENPIKVITGMEVH
ncbi:DNA packaging protein, partial [Sutterella massiliensis]